MNEVGAIVPTLNAGNGWRQWLKAFERQNKKPDYRLVVDSSSADNTAALAREHGFNVHVIPRAEFNHGATWQLGAGMLPAAEIIVFVTQDALLASPDAIEKLLMAFEDERVGVRPTDGSFHTGTPVLSGRMRVSLTTRLTVKYAAWTIANDSGSRRRSFRTPSPPTSAVP